MSLAVNICNVKKSRKMTQLTYRQTYIKQNSAALYAFGGLNKQKFYFKFTYCVSRWLFNVAQICTVQCKQKNSAAM